MGEFVTFTFTPPKLDHAKVPLAIARGLNEAGDKVRTRVMRHLKQQTNVESYRSITSRIRTVRAGPGSLRYVITTPSKAMPITEFDVRATDKGIEATTWGAHLKFQRSFMVHGRFEARTGPGRFPLIRLKGVNLAKELELHGLPEVFAQASAEFVPPIVLKHILRAIG